MKMARTKSNQHINIVKDDKKSYVYIKERTKDLGVLMWHYEKKKWVFDNWQGRPKLKK